MSVENQTSLVIKIDGLLRDSKILRLLEEYENHSQKQSVDLGFNVFSIVSEIYHRENLHSDILRAFLDPNGLHGDGSIYLQQFLKFLQKLKPDLNLENYREARVEREESRIDILIEGLKQAIIIENKINSAGDMEGQIPRYLKKINDKKYACDGVVYLTLNRCAVPDKKNWSTAEKEEVDKILIVVCAFGENEDSLLNGWIRECENLPGASVDARLLLKHYGLLIRKLGRKVINKSIMEKFFNLMKDEGKLKAALELRKMLGELIEYRADRIFDHFKMSHLPFESISIASGNDVFFVRTIEGVRYGVDVIVEDLGYVFQFWDKDDRFGVKGRAGKLLKQMDCFDEYGCNSGKFEKYFKFPSEEDPLIQHIQAFQGKLTAIWETKNQAE